eukprot:m.337994 g.337994  ORF g.337994 m.337994 type:complete len:335 (+) comp18286_c0_seq1:186-1190(+)
MTKQKANTVFHIRRRRVFLLSRVNTKLVRLFGDIVFAMGGRREVVLCAPENKKVLATFIDWGVAMGVVFLGVFVQLAGTTWRYDACLKYANESEATITARECGVLWNNALGFPSVKETVTTAEVVVVFLAVPLFVMVCRYLFEMYTHANEEQRRKNLLLAVLTLVQSLGLTFLLTECAKHYVGMLRPDAYVVLSHGNSGARLDAHWSYPSGHASMSFAGLITTFLYLADKLQVMNGPGNSWKLLALLVFPIFAGFVSISRIVNYRHHPSDVNAGMLLGTSISVLYYHANFVPSWTRRGFKKVRRNGYNGIQYGRGAQAVPDADEEYEYVVSEEF